MLQKFSTFCGVLVALLTMCANPALAAKIDGAYATVNCSAYNLSLSASGLVPGTKYQIEYTIQVSGHSPITLIMPFTATSATYSGTIWGPFADLSGTLGFSGIVSLSGSNTTPMSFSTASVTCGTPPPQTYTAQSTNSSNFNGTPINSGNWIWLNANFSATGIPSTGAVLTFTNSSISGVDDGFMVPNAQITFSPSATCSSTTFDTVSNTWITTVPVSGDDEIFLSGLAIPVPPSGMAGGANVGWTGTFDTNGVPGIAIEWKWGAAAFSSLTTDYNALAVKTGHQTGCGQQNGDHAGVPEGANSDSLPWKVFVIGGARGGGGSNWTGSWSGTQGASPVLAPSGPGGPKS